MIEVNLTQGSREWHDWRLSGLGASEIPALLNRSPFPGKDRSSLFAEKTTGVIDKQTNYQMRQGNRLEPVARDRYIRETGFNMVPKCGSHPEQEWMHVSLDGMNDTFRKFIEIKYSRPEWHLMAMMGLVPDHVDLQMQWQFMVTGYTWGEYVSITDNETEFTRADMRFRIVRNKPNAELMAHILTEAERFWAEVLAWRASPRPVVDAREVVADWAEADERQGAIR